MFKTDAYFNKINAAAIKLLTDVQNFVVNIKETSLSISNDKDPVFASNDSSAAETDLAKKDGNKVGEKRVNV